MNFKEQLTREVDQAVAKFRKGVEKIENSPNPYYREQAVKDFEIGKLKAELETQVADINAKYREQSEELLEQAKCDAAFSYFKPSPADKEFTGAILDEFTSDLAFARKKEEKIGAVRALEERFDHLTETQLFAVKSKLPQELQSVSGDEFAVGELKRINGALSNLRTEEQEALEEAKTIALSTPDTAYRRLKMTHKVFQSEQKARRSSHTQL